MRRRYCCFSGAKSQQTVRTFLGSQGSPGKADASGRQLTNVASFVKRSSPSRCALCVHVLRYAPCPLGTGVAVHGGTTRQAHGSSWGQAVCSRAADAAGAAGSGRGEYGERQDETSAHATTTIHGGKEERTKWLTMHIPRLSADHCVVAQRCPASFCALGGAVRWRVALITLDDGSSRRCSCLCLSLSSTCYLQHEFCYCASRSLLPCRRRRLLHGTRRYDRLPFPILHYCTCLHKRCTWLRLSVRDAIP